VSKQDAATQCAGKTSRIASCARRADERTRRLKSLRNGDRRISLVDEPIAADDGSQSNQGFPTIRSDRYLGARRRSSVTCVIVFVVRSTMSKHLVHW
jgi:hypothetical protein